MKKLSIILGVVIVTLLVGVVIFCGFWVKRNWQAVYSSTMDGVSIYTDSDMKESYNAGYSAGVKSESDYKGMIAKLRDKLTVMQIENDSLNFLIEDDKTKYANDIAELNRHIDDLVLFGQTQEAEIIKLNSDINNLQNSIATYENYISNIAAQNDQVIVRYKVANAVVDIVIVDRDSEITLPTISNTENYIFNGWTVSGVDGLLGDTYTVTADTDIVANVTFQYTVNFINGADIYSMQIVTENTCAVVPTAPTKAKYEFIGWAINGVDVVTNIDNIPVTKNVNYYAVFVELHTVRFVNHGAEYTTQTIRHDKCALLPTAPTYYDYQFIGWSLSRDSKNVVDVELVPITGDMVYYAVFKEQYTIQFVIDWDSVDDVDKTGEETIYEFRIVDGDYVTYQMKIWVDIKMSDRLREEGSKYVFTGEWYYDNCPVKEYTTSPDKPEDKIIVTGADFTTLAINQNYKFTPLEYGIENSDKPVDPGDLF